MPFETLDELREFTRSVWGGLPLDLRRALEHRGVTVSISDVDPAPALGVYMPPSRCIVIYWVYARRQQPAEVERTILHEIGHACGMNHAQLDRLRL